MKKILLLGLALTRMAACQNPDCQINFDVTNGSSSSIILDNTSKGCVKWYFTAVNRGAGTTAIAVQTSIDNSTFTSSAVTYTNLDDTTGTFPITVGTVHGLTFKDFGRFLKVKLTTAATGSRVTGTLKGYSNLSASSTAASTPATAQGFTKGATSAIAMTGSYVDIYSVTLTAQAVGHGCRLSFGTTNNNSGTNFQFAVKFGTDLFEAVGAIAAAGIWKEDMIFGNIADSSHQFIIPTKLMTYNNDDIQYQNFSKNGLTTWTQDWSSSKDLKIQAKSATGGATVTGAYFNVDCV